MTKKSHVSTEQRVCVVCGKTYDTNTILLDTRLRDSMERHTVTGFGMCPDHEKLRDDGYIALVGADEAKSEFLPNGNVKPEGAYRTGLVAHLKREAFDRVFDIPAPEDGVLFCTDEVISMLQQMREGSHE